MSPSTLALVLATATVAAAACGAGCGGGDGDDAGDAGPTEERCGPTGGGPHWLVEGETVTVDLVCRTGMPVPGGFTLDPIPAGASFDAASARLTWTPSLDQAAVYRLTAAAPELDEEGEIVIGVADAYDAPGNVPVIDPLAYPLELGLPVLFLSPAPTAEEPYVPVTIVYGGQTIAAEGKLRGASSLSYPKKSYTLKFDGVRFSDPDRDGGFTGKRRIVLTSTFDDNSYLRQWLAFELWSALEPTMPVQSYVAVVYVDGEYFGLYTVTDHLDDDFMQASGLSDNGNLYKAVNHDANFRLTQNDGDPKATPHDGYEKKEGLPVGGQPGAFDDLDALVDFVATSDGPTFAAEIGDRVLLDDYQAWWMIAVLLRADDSAGKNSYHYHDATRSWRVAPWDFNASFGQSWQTYRLPPGDTSDYASVNRLFERLLADPGLGPPMRQRFRQALDGGALDPDTVTALIDDFAAQLGRSGERDWAAWQDDYRSFDWSDRTDWTTFQEEVAYVRAWVVARSAALETYLAE